MTIEKPQDQEITMYTSAHLAEFYDIYWKDFFANCQDSKVYANLLQGLQDRSASPGPLTVLDLATGTGRIIRDIINYRKEKGSGNIRFIGLDIAQDMLDRASKSVFLTGKNEIPPSWILGSALDLESPLESYIEQQSVDLITLAFGSIAHFCEDGQPERLFHQMAQVLRPGTGQAALSFLAPFVDVKGQVNPPGEAQTPQMPSLKFPGVYYQETLVGMTVERGVYVDRREITVTKIENDGHQKTLLSKEEIVTKMRLFQSDEINSMAEAAGLEVVDVVKIPEEFIWVVQRKG